MYTETPAVVMRQIKTVNGRRMIVLFSRKYGKISAGTSISESGKNKSALALRPYTYGRYELSKVKDNFYINGAEVLRSYYRIGEDVDKYLQASYVLEFTDKLLPEGEPAEALFDLLTEFLSMMEERKQAYGTLVLGYLCQAIAWSGSAPDLGVCSGCKDAEVKYFSVKDGGLLCEDCAGKAVQDRRLIFPVTVDIIDVFNYLLESPLKSLHALALREDLEKKVRNILRSYIAYHLGIEELKSESLIV
ncbi:MAG TPA: DNA repair protein RecO [Clostridiales bacterium]|jgi:DNA repair protein RecO (recombination protein O)|nr:DNA repair protein RecO [Clostridiales bacterium]